MSMFILEDAFIEQVWDRGVFRKEDIAGKRCLIVGGHYIKPSVYPSMLRGRLLQLGAAICDNIILFSPSVSLASYIDLTDVEKAVGGARYDCVFVLSGMEKTRQIAEGVRQIQAACRPGGKIFLAVRTKNDLTARDFLDYYEDTWRYELTDLCALFSDSSLELHAEDKEGKYIAALFERHEGMTGSSADSLFHVRSGRRISLADAIPEGYFHDESHLDAIGIRFRTDKCSLDHNYLAKYAFFLERFRHKPMRLLELGVFYGSSLRMWQEYFPLAEIFGVDIMENCAQYADTRIHVLQADLSAAEEVRALRDVQPQIIIDDASHIVSHQLLALFTLFEALPSGGLYILEDLETSLNPEIFGDSYRDSALDAYAVCARIARVAASKVPNDDSVYAADINRIGMETEMVSITKGSVILIKR